MNLQKAARRALRSAVRKVCLLGYTLKEALERLLRPTGELMFFICCAIYDSIQMMHDLLGTAMGICRETTRRYLEAMAEEARRRKHVLATTN